MAGLWLTNGSGRTVNKGEIVKIDTTTNQFTIPLTPSGWTDATACGTAIINIAAGAAGPIAISGMPNIMPYTNAFQGRHVSPDIRGGSYGSDWKHSPVNYLGIWMRGAGDRELLPVLLMPGGSGFPNIQSSLPATGQATGFAVWDTTGLQLGIWTAGATWRTIKLSAATDYSVVDPNTYAFYFDDFLGQAIRSEWTTTGDATPVIETDTTTYPSGVIRCATPAINGQKSILSMGTSGENWDVVLLPIIELRVKCSDTGSSFNTWVGLSNNAGNRLINVGQDTLSGNYTTNSWYILYNGDSGVANQETNTAVAADNNWHTFKFEFISSTEVITSVDGTIINTRTVDFSTTRMLQPRVYVRTRTGAVRTVYCDYIKVFHTR